MGPGVLYTGGNNANTIDGADTNDNATQLH